MLRRGHSLHNNPFDYEENADNDSSLSTPSNSYWDSPFAQDSLGETVIHLDKVGFFILFTINSLFYVST